MPNQPRTPARSIRIPTDLWRAVQTRAAEEDRTVTSVVLDALRRYVAE